MELHTFINANINREKLSKLQAIKDGNYRIFIEDNENPEYNIFDKERFTCFLEKEIRILNDEFAKM